MVNIIRGQAARSSLVPLSRADGEQLRNNVNNFLADGGTHALPDVKNGFDFAISILPDESATVTGIGLIDNSGNATIKFLAYQWVSGTATLYE